MDYHMVPWCPTSIFAKVLHPVQLSDLAHCDVPSRAMLLLSRAAPRLCAMSCHTQLGWQQFGSQEPAQGPECQKSILYTMCYALCTIYYIVYVHIYIYIYIITIIPYHTIPYHTIP